MSLRTSVQSKRGQGLLEIIIGLGVILAGTVGTITLIATTIKAGRSSNNQVIAASLAREGIEVVRNIRDSNWLEIQANVDVDAATSGIQLRKSFDGLFNETTPRHKAIPVFKYETNTWAVESLGPPLPLPIDFDTDCPSTGPDHNCSDVYIKAGMYVQSVTPKGALPLSRFRRLLTINPICRVDANTDGIPDVGVGASEETVQADGATCDPAATKLLVGLQVRSRIEWNEGASPKSYELEGRLYNWKYAK